MPPASSSAISILPTNIVVPKSASSGSTLRVDPKRHAGSTSAGSSASPSRRAALSARGGGPGARREGAGPAPHARRGHRSRLRDPLHHAAAVDLTRRARVLGEHPLDHLDGGFGDGRHERLRWYHRPTPPGPAAPPA